MEKQAMNIRAVRANLPSAFNHEMRIEIMRETNPKTMLEDERALDRRAYDAPIMTFFEYEHLPEHLQKISKPICELAETMILGLPDNKEKEFGLRKLLEAKDCFVRANL